VILPMRKITAKKIGDTVAELCGRANILLRPDVLAVLRSARKKEKNRLAASALEAILQNARVAAEEGMPICQDTGLPYVFLEIGQGVCITGGGLSAAVNDGVKRGYGAACCRESVVLHPLSRGRSAYTPAVIHTEIVPSDKIRVTVFPKGFGSENKTKLKMFRPTEDISAVAGFIVSCVAEAGADACPPYMIGCGIGGGADQACLLAKKALLRDVRKRSPDPVLRKLEDRVLREVNRLGIGPMGLGGKCTALAVNIESSPTHIAGLPVAVNISCHALRSAAAVI